MKTNDIVFSGKHGGCSWDIDKSGTLTIYPTNGRAGMLAQTSLPSDSGWNQHSQHIFNVVVKDGVRTNTDASFLFYRLKKCKTMDLWNLSTEKTSNFTAMFFGCESLAELHIENFDTRNAVNMRSMFAGCKSLTELDLGSFDTSKVFNMVEMFMDCENLKNLEIYGFDISNIENDRNMFKNCSNLNGFELQRQLLHNAKASWHPEQQKEKTARNTTDIDR